MHTIPALEGWDAQAWDSSCGPQIGVQQANLLRQGQLADQQLCPLAGCQRGLLPWRFTCMPRVWLCWARQGDLISLMIEQRWTSALLCGGLQIRKEGNYRVRCRSPRSLRGFIAWDSGCLPENLAPPVHGDRNRVKAIVSRALTIDGEASQVMTDLVIASDGRVLC